jgi:hypothetical protein
MELHRAAFGFGGAAIMNSPDQSPNRLPSFGQSTELEQLLAALTDGELADEQFRRLEEILAEDPVARADYHRQLQVHTLLLYGHQSSAASQPATEHRRLDSAEEFAKYVYRASNQAVWQDELQRDAAFFCTPQAADHPLAIPDLSPLPELGGDFPTGIRTYLPWLTSGLFGAALIAVIVFSWALPRDRFSPEVAATDAGNKSFKPLSVHILSGTTKLLLPQIGHVIIDAPAEFDMLDPMRARLTKGRIRARVTEESGHGFTVETPYGEVTDLGTEFGLDLTQQGRAGLVVFEGAVNLRVAFSNPLNASKVQQLIGGEAVTFQEGGLPDRIESILTGAAGTFRQVDAQTPPGEQKPTILSVRDSKRKGETNKFYEIVVGGLREDALAYVDRPHEWNGLTKAGMPAYLLGADYVKTFNDHRMRRDFKIRIALACPAKLYVFFDERIETPDWLKKYFRNTGDKIGLDGGAWRSRGLKRKIGVGPGVNVESTFAVWERKITKPRTVTLGPDIEDLKKGDEIKYCMYGIAAVPLEPQKEPRTLHTAIRGRK